jgi:hypothetical protein
VSVLGEYRRQAPLVREQANLTAVRADLQLHHRRKEMRNNLLAPRAVLLRLLRLARGGREREIEKRVAGLEARSRSTAAAQKGSELCGLGKGQKKKVGGGGMRRTGVVRVWVRRC